MPLIKKSIHTVIWQKSNEATKDKQMKKTTKIDKSKRKLEML